MTNNKAFPFKLYTGIRSWLSSSSQVPFHPSAHPTLTAQTPNRSRENKACTPFIHFSVGAASNMTAFFIVSLISVPTHGVNERMKKRFVIWICAFPYSLSRNSKHLQTQEPGESGGEQAMQHWLLHVPGSGKENECQFSYHVLVYTYTFASYYLKYDLNTQSRKPYLFKWYMKYSINRENTSLSRLYFKMIVKHYGSRQQTC